MTGFGQCPFANLHDVSEKLGAHLFSKGIRDHVTPSHPTDLSLRLSQVALENRQVNCRPFVVNVG